ncbi:Sigma-70, region 4 [Clostridiales bacterium CHKCI001]|nr:Sigma-70, region 4 [Clostridiales bacterium CHKCI001]
MLSSKQKTCVELMILGDVTQKEIAKQINISEKTICT